MKHTHKTILLTLALLSIFPQISNAQFSMSSEGKANNEINYEITPGETVTGKLTIKSYTDKNIDITLYGADGTQTDRGAFTLTQPYLVQNNLGQWLKLPKTQITIEPKKTQEIEYSISIPANATPGTYGGGIAAVTTPNKKPGSEAPSGASIVSSTRMLFPIFVTIPGEKTIKYSWDEFSYRSINSNNIFQLKLKNEGNTTITADGKIEISGGPFFKSKTITFNKITLFSDDEILIPINWNEKPLLGFFESKAKLTFSEHDAKTGEDVTLETINKSISFTIIPWAIILGVLLIVALLIAIKIMRSLQEEKLIKSCKKYTVKEGETLQGLAEKHNFPWEKLAKINGLKPPYTLKNGDEILIPQKKA